MAHTKAILFDEKQKRKAELAKALAHPARVAILEMLAEIDTCVCGDITDRLPLAQSTVSQHLKVLKKSGLIRGEIEGVRTCYCIDWEAAAGLRELFGDLTARLEPPAGEACC